MNIKLGDSVEKESVEKESVEGDLNKILGCIKVGETLVTEKCIEAFRNNPESFSVQRR